MSSTSSIEPVIDGDRVEINLKIEVDANLQEETCPIPINSVTVKEMEKEINKVLKNDITDAIAKAQNEYRSDIFGFGEEVRRADRQYWKKHKYEWNDIFSEVPVHVEVKSNIRRTGKVTDNITFPKESEGGK